jgi:hypothetical protein
MEVLCGLARWLNGWHNWRVGKAIRGKWRILGGKVESGLDRKFGAPRWWPPPMLIKACVAHIGWALLYKHLNVLTHTGRDELGDSLPRFIVIQWDSVQATHSVFTEAYVWKTAPGRGRTWPSLLIRSWTVATRGAPGLRVSCCQVYTIARLTIDSNLCGTLGHGWWLVHCI